MRNATVNRNGRDDSDGNFADKVIARGGVGNHQESKSHVSRVQYPEEFHLGGWIYGQTWASAANSGLIRNGAPRTAMTYLMEQLGRPTP